MKYFLYFCLIFSSLYAQNKIYNHYFGNLHSHTWYSDGNKDQDTNTYKLPVAKAINYGRTVALNLNYLAITDHNHNEGLNMTLPRWRSGVNEADTANKENVFVGIFGQEWGTLATYGGHTLIFNTDKLIGWNLGVYDVYVAKNDYNRLWKVVDSLNAFCYLAHPNNTDFGNLLSKSYDSNIDKVLQATAIKSGPAFSTNTTMTDPSTTTYESYYHSLLKLGYHIAPTADQDNHYTNFGMSNQQRSVVLAKALTKTDILTALKNRNVYASEDVNVKVDFDINDSIMGGIITLLTPFNIRVKVTDETPNDNISKIEIRCGIPGSGTNPTVLTSISNSDSLSYSVNQPVSSTYYYYVFVQQNDGQRVWTAPIWVTVNGYLPVTFGSLIANKMENSNYVKIEWSTVSEINNLGFYVQRKGEYDTEYLSLNEDIIPGSNTTLQNQFYYFIDTTIISNGNYYYRIKQVDNNGLESYSNPILFNFNPTEMKDYELKIYKYELKQNYPNPFNPSTRINYTVPKSGFVHLAVYDIYGKQVQLIYSGFQTPGEYSYEFNAIGLASGVYYYKLITNDQYMVKKMLLMK